MLQCEDTPFIVIPGRLNKLQCEQVCNCLNITPHPIIYSRFADGEIDLLIGPPVRHHLVFIVMSPYPELEEQLIELLFIVDAVNRAAAQRIVVILTLFPYSVDTRTCEEQSLDSKQSKLTRIPEEQLERIQSGRLLASLMEESGVEEVLSLELCHPQWEGLFSIPFTNLACHQILSSVIDKHISDSRIHQKCVVVPFKMHSSKRCDRIAISCEMELEKAVVYERQNGHFLYTQGFDFTDKHVFIICDFLRSSEGLLSMARWLSGDKRTAKITVIVIHSLLTADCIENIELCGVIDCIYTSDSLELANLNPKLKSFTVSSAIAMGIQNIVDGRDLSELSVTD